MNALREWELCPGSETKAFRIGVAPRTGLICSECGTAVDANPSPTHNRIVLP